MLISRLLQEPHLSILLRSPVGEQCIFSEQERQGENRCYRYFRVRNICKMALILVFSAEAILFEPSPLVIPSHFALTIE